MSVRPVTLRNQSNKKLPTSSKNYNASKLYYKVGFYTIKSEVIGHFLNYYSIHKKKCSYVLLLALSLALYSLRPQVSRRLTFRARLRALLLYQHYFCGYSGLPRYCR